MTTLTRAYIDLNALQNNVAYLKQQSPFTKVWGVVKANAYGHGIKFAVQALSNLVDGFAVAHWEEALELQEILQQYNLPCIPPILLLEGINSEVQYQEADKIPSARLVIHDLSQIKSLISIQSTIKSTLHLWLKFDSGMHRLGLNEAELLSVFNQFTNSSIIKIEGILSHFACAEDPQHALSQIQLNNIFKLRQKIQNKFPHIVWSTANSAGIVQQLAQANDWIRPGIALYGSSPLDNKIPELKPVMTLTTKILSIKELEAGESVGYGATFHAQNKMRMAVLGIGYADGYPRILSNQGIVWAEGYELPVIGRVSMDLTCVALPFSNEIIFKPGTEIELWGKNISVDVVASRAQTISYELLTGVGQRVPRITFKS